MTIGAHFDFHGPLLQHGTVFFLEYSKVSRGVVPITSPGLLSFRSAGCPEMCYKRRLIAVASVVAWVYTGAREVFQSYP